MNVVLVVLGSVLVVLFAVGVIIVVYNLLMGMAGYTSVHSSEERKAWLVQALQTALYTVDSTDLLQDSETGTLSPSILHDVTRNMNVYLHMYRVQITVSESDVEVLYAEFRRERYDGSLAGLIERFAGSASSMRQMRPDANGPMQGGTPAT